MSGDSSSGDSRAASHPGVHTSVFFQRLYGAQRRARSPLFCVSQTPTSCDHELSFLPLQKFNRVLVQLTSLDQVKSIFRFVLDSSTESLPSSAAVVVCIKGPDCPVLSPSGHTLIPLILVHSCSVPI